MGELGKFQGIFFVVFIEADYNRLKNYNITKFNIFVRSWGESSCGGEGGGSGGSEGEEGVLRLSFERLERGKGA